MFKFLHHETEADCKRRGNNVYFLGKGRALHQRPFRQYARAEPGYTTVAKQVCFLEEKGFLKRRPLANLFLYKAAVTEKEYRGSTISEVVRKYYSSSYSSLVLQFVEEKKMDLDELKEIIDIIENRK